MIQLTDELKQFLINKEAKIFSDSASWFSFCKEFDATLTDENIISLHNEWLEYLKTL
jgi:hypothetical protein